MVTRIPVPSPKTISQQPTLPLLNCAQIVQALADVFRLNLTPAALNAYVITVGHRSEEDLNKAYRGVLRNKKFMPTPSELLDECGIKSE